MVFPIIAVVICLEDDNARIHQVQTVKEWGKKSHASFSHMDKLPWSSFLNFTEKLSDSFLLNSTQCIVSLINLSGTKYLQQLLC